MVGQEGQRASTGKSSGQDKISMNSFNLLSSFFFYIFALPPPSCPGYKKGPSFFKWGQPRPQSFFPSLALNG